MNAGNLKQRVERRGQEDPNGHQQLGEQMLLAIEEVANELDGEEFAKVILELAVTDFPLPSAGALEVLEMLEPGSAMKVMICAREIRKNEQRQERKEYQKEVVLQALGRFTRFKS